MASEPLIRYRKLDAQLVRERWHTGGQSSPTIEQILTDMEEAWWDLDEAEQYQLKQEPPRSLLPRDLLGPGPRPITTLQPTPKSCLVVAWMHQEEAAELVKQLPRQAPPEQLDHLLAFGPACARAAQVSTGDLWPLTGRELSADIAELALALDPIAHQHAVQTNTAPLVTAEPSNPEQRLADAKNYLQKVTMELISAGKLRREDLPW